MTTPTAEEIGYEKPYGYSSSSAHRFLTHSTLNGFKKGQQGKKGWRGSPNVRVLTFGISYQVKSLISLKDFFSACY